MATTDVTSVRPIHKMAVEVISMEKTQGTLNVMSIAQFVVWLGFLAFWIYGIPPMVPNGYVFNWTQVAYLWFPILFVFIILEWLAYSYYLKQMRTQIADPNNRNRPEYLIGKSMMNELNFGTILSTIGAIIAWATTLQFSLGGGVPDSTVVFELQDLPPEARVGNLVHLLVYHIGVLMGLFTLGRALLLHIWPVASVTNVIGTLDYDKTL